MSHKDSPPETPSQTSCREWWQRAQPHVSRAWGQAKNGAFLAEETRLLHEAWCAAAHPTQSAQFSEALEQVRDWLLARANDGQMQRSVYVSDYQLREMAAAITAHLAQPAQSVDVDAIVPTSWLDSMLTGPHAVIGKPPYDCDDIERVLNEVRFKLTAALQEKAG